MMLLQSFHNVIANDKPRWKLCTKHILFKLRQNYTLCQIFLISWSSFNSSFLTCESQAVVLKKNGKLVMYYYVQCIHIVNFSSKRAPILCKHPYILISTHFFVLTTNLHCFIRNTFIRNSVYWNKKWYSFHNLRNNSAIPEY